MFFHTTHEPAQEGSPASSSLDRIPRVALDHAMKPHLIRTLLAGVTVTLAGCQTAPLSFLDGQPLTRNDTTLSPLQVVSVDGVIQFRNPVQVAPGPRRLTLEAAPGAGARTGVQRSFVMKIEPCTRYYLAARRASPMASDWSLVIDSTEAVTSCDPAVELKNAGATSPGTAASASGK